MLEKGVPRNVIAKSLHMSSTTITALKSRNENEMIPPLTAWGDPHSSLTGWYGSSTTTGRLTPASLTRTWWDEWTKFFHTSVSRTTIIRCRNRLKYEYTPPRTLQQLTDEQKELRVIFCDWVVNHTFEVRNLPFTDERRFHKGPDNQWRWMKRCVVNNACFDAKLKFPESIMMSGGIAISKQIVCFASPELQSPVMVGK